MGKLRLQTSILARLRNGIQVIEDGLEFERDQLPLWLPVMLGTGIFLWFSLQTETQWIGVMTSSLALAVAGFVVSKERRLGRAMISAGLMLCLGCGLAWWRADSAAAPVLARPQIASFMAKVERIDQRGRDGGLRMMLRPINAPGLPQRVRVTADDTIKVPKDLQLGDQISLQARLMPPADAMVPGAYDFSRVAWFQGIGATGRAIGKITRAASQDKPDERLRDRLSRHILAQVPGSTGGIAAALVTGDRAAMSEADEQAMRDSGLAHLLSISGLHITAVVGAAMFVALRLLALSPFLALRLPLIVISAGFGAAAGIGYTLLTGSEVPTVRSCIAAILILIGIVMGREAMTLRVVAVGAMVVLLFWPESLMGPSFQLSFAAVTSIVAINEWPVYRALVSAREEGLLARVGRMLLGLLLTGIAVELALAPIALFHFHKTGLYGALANIVAIPMTTFLIMPLEALALTFDAVGAGAPFWWLVHQLLQALLFMAHWISGLPGAVTALPTMPIWAFGVMVGGALWLMLWRSRFRLFGLIPVVFGLAIAAMTSSPDVLLTGDGRHLAVRGEDGQYALLRPRAGEFVRNMLAETAGFDGVLGEIEALSSARCNDDVCTIRLDRYGRSWRILATRSRHVLPWRSFVALCAEADIVISDRRLPKGCMPRWIKADRAFLEQTGGLSIHLDGQTVQTTRNAGDEHPWIMAANAARAADAAAYAARKTQYRRNSPASLP